MARVPGAESVLPEPLREMDVRGTAPVPFLQLMTLQAFGRGYRPLSYFLEVAGVQFEYAGIRLNRDSPRRTRAFHDGAVVHIERDARSEKRFYDRLKAAGLVPLAEVASDYPYEHARDYALRDPRGWPDFVFRTLPRLRAEGWRVEVDESFRFKPVEHGEWLAEVESAGQDWFDLSLGLELDGAVLDVLPLLMAALRTRPELMSASGRADRPEQEPLYVRLDDGRLLPVPVERLGPILSILHELLDAQPVGKVRLARLDAVRLADLEREAGLHWRGDEGLRELGRRLADFAGIEPVEPPRGLAAQLRPYQLQGVAWLQFLREYSIGGILADDMGLGKTIQALAHILIEKEAGRLDRPALVITPTSVVPNWKAEAARFAPGLRVHVSHGLKRRDSFDRLAGSDLVLTTYPLLARDREALVAQPFHLIVLDEAQQIKNAKTQSARVVTQLSARHRLCLTGTPLENHLGELWSLFHFLMPGFLGDAVTFGRLYRTPIEKRRDEARRTNLARRIRPFLLRRTKEQVATELPPKTEIVHAVELSGAQRDLYETVRASMHERVRDEIAARGLAQSQIVVLDALLKLRQICCDPRLLKLDAAKKVAESAKLDALLDMLEELLQEGRRVLLFSQFTSMLELIEAELKRLDIRYVKLTGETRDRKRPVEAFQSGKVPLFLISLKAGGTGLNLTAADIVIHYDPWWNPAVERQATDRAHRIGQDKPVFAYKLIVAGSVEEKIAQLQAAKAALAAGVLGEGGVSGAALAAEDIAALFEPLA
jgi:SNF2 family DNA or RNA helicase